MEFTELSMPLAGFWEWKGKEKNGREGEAACYCCIIYFIYLCVSFVTDLMLSCDHDRP